VGADREHHVDHRAIGNFGQANYAASKGRLAAFSTSLAKELVSKGITVNCVAPGVTDTEMVMAMPEKVRMKLLEQIPMSVLADPKKSPGPASISVPRMVTTSREPSSASTEVFSCGGQECGPCTWFDRSSKMM
jgi:NAD(P)-dependent dehydrogenase (short-subunit alcohol dehydrogenase family)